VSSGAASLASTEALGSARFVNCARLSSDINAGTIRTTILAYVIAFLDVVMIGTGGWTLFNLFVHYKLPAG
jgi:hypothetical protein